MDDEMIKLGPVGYSSGKKWDDGGHSSYSEITQIFIWHTESTISGIQFQYVENGTLVLSELHGCSAATKFCPVKLNYPSEFITWIKGHIYKDPFTSYLSSLTFGTNQRTHGPFGSHGRDDMEFHFQLGEDRGFGGFHGTTNISRITSIGVYFKVATTLGALYKNDRQLKDEKG